jgi:transcriptional regulator with XRE-family HTH domain
MFPIGRGQLVRVPPHTDRQRLADALKARRADLRWTQTAVAEKAGVSIAGPGFVAEVKQSEDLPDLLDQMPAAMRALWERMATGIAAELVAVSGQNPANDLTISDEALTTRTEFGDTYLAHTADTAPEKEQVEKATVQLQQALELLRPHTRRSVR